MKQNEQIDRYKYERELKEKGFKLIAGVDEAGRGPLAGPVYAAACILDENEHIEGLADSKKLSEKKRSELYEIIIKKALAYAVCSVSAERIDEINILEATYEAMNGAVQSLKIKPDFVIIDGNRIKNMDYVEHMTLVKGDNLSASVAAASILAKVSRDRYMEEMATLYPVYEFEKHKAYGTKRHLELIAMFGPCPIHRKTFRGVKEYVK